MWHNDYDFSLLNLGRLREDGALNEYLAISLKHVIVMAYSCQVWSIDVQLYLITSDLLHELSSDGDWVPFDLFLRPAILRKMLQSTNYGDRECHIVIVLMDDEVVESDDDYPLLVGEEFTQRICLSRCDARDKPAKTSLQSHQSATSRWPGTGRRHHARESLIRTWQRCRDTTQ